jgi:hypothetical protein
MFNPVTMKYLAHVWGVGVNSPTNLLNEQQSVPKFITISPVSLEGTKATYSAKSESVKEFRQTSC